MAGEIAAGALAADRQSAVTTQRAAVLGQPSQRVVAIGQRGREGVLRRQAIVERDDGHPTPAGDRAQDRVDVIGRAAVEPAPVQPRENWTRRAEVGAVNAYPYGR